MPSAFHQRKRMKEVLHSILDLFSEKVYGLGRARFNFSSSDLTPNAQAHLLPEAGARHKRTL
jgi:hypothetical protein